MTTDPTFDDDGQTRDPHGRLFAQAARLAKLGAWECDLATEQLIWTDGVYDLFDLPVGAPLKRNAIVDLYLDESRQEMELLRAEVIRTGQSCMLDARIRTQHGDTRWMRLWVDVAYENGVATHVFGAKQDVTREREALERLRHMAERDPLTGLANRGLFDAHYREMVNDRLNHGCVAALALIDLDHFKRINDGFGHDVGDECLRQAAMRLQRVFADAILVARIGGDEFAVLLRAPLGAARIRHMLNRAAEALRKPIILRDQCFDTSASIGATILGGPHLRNPSELFKEADMALYAAKTAGRQSVRIFGEDQPEPAVVRPTTRRRA